MSSKVAREIGEVSPRSSDTSDSQDELLPVSPTALKDASRGARHVDRFWESYFQTSFLVLLGELAAGLTYFFLTPGPHRDELITIAIASLAVSFVGFVGIQLAAPRAWRSEINVTWILFAGVITTWTAHLDKGINSPLVIMFVLPIAAAALGLSVRNVVICGLATLGELTYVWLSDPTRGPAANTALLATAIVGMIVFAVGTTVARTRLQHDERLVELELIYRAKTDSLTDCLNHGAFYERLDAEINRAHRDHQSLSLLMIDVDLFKAFNDTYGHQAGDDALMRVGGVFKHLSRSFDVVGRVGGDEFSVILPTATATEALEIATRFTERIAQECAPLSVSVGTASLGRAFATAPQLVREADASLYRAKSSGRNRVDYSKRRGHMSEGGASPRSELRHAALRAAEEHVRESDRATAEALSVLDAYQATTTVGLGFVDCEFRVVRANPMLAAVNGSSVDDQLGRKLEEVVPELWPTLAPLYRSVIETASPVVNLEISGNTADDPGATHWWIINLYPVSIENRVIGVGIVVLDITDRKRLEESHVQLTRSVVAALAGAVEMRDPYTAGHEDRVTISAVLVAADLGLSSHEIESISLGGRIHDIGKLAIPAEILSRPGRLSNAETGLIRTHAQAGFDMLERVGFPSDASEIVLQHHERLDGSGYPSGLKGREVCIGAQIVAVADVFDAMASDRPYRALGADAAIEELRNGSGTKYNADVVTAFVKLFEANKISV